jgi:hypothetical protein
MGRLKQLTEHIHSASKVAPSLADGIVVTGGAGAWELGAFSADIIAAGAQADDYDVHYVHIEATSANDEYEVVLYYGAGDTEAGRCRVLNGTTLDSSTAPMMTPLISAGSRLRAKCASKSGGGDTVTISVQYHTY